MTKKMRKKQKAFDLPKRTTGDIINIVFEIIETIGCQREGI
jgi:hypothetical protein